MAEDIPGVPSALCLPLCETVCSPEGLLGSLVTALSPACLLDDVCHQHSPNKLVLCALNAVPLSFLSRVKERRDGPGSMDLGLGNGGGRACRSHLCLIEMLTPFTDATKATPWGIRKAINPCRTKAGNPCSGS